ncbi:PREDICTED: golgin-84 [Dufourea novaeangliae]|uniref:Golgin subfamily A member 5 n=1 Tax=Dufourea novaeangliae TaxID=178035 RepID=A0A154PDK2_DUFNO|nr:PREDICTED: golgin-84 [Dufourea novaeangliae]XP_015431845.1 PREDICTED: golgin-84 [Dufourea novaeangliae]KZC09979.1 Golgin subfamily A member 5 [Dufourea novaeangliae]
MAWLSGLADKAENLLNKIDKNTAAVLNKDKYEVSQSQLTEVTWTPPELRLNTQEEISLKSASGSTNQFPYVRSVPSLSSLATNSIVSKDEELLTFLNTPDSSPKKTMAEVSMSPPTPSSLMVEHPTDTTDSVSELSIHSGRSSPSLMHTSVDVPDDLNHDIINTRDEASYKNDIVHKLNNGIAGQQILGIMLDNEGSVVERQFDVVSQSGYEYESKPEILEVNTLHSSHDKNIRKYLKEVERNLEEKNELLGKQETDHQKEIVVLNEKLQSLYMERVQLSKLVIELQSALERSRLELNSTRSDLEQYKARALKTLHEKKKLIAELRNNESTEVDDTMVMELNQLRQERDTFREENQQISEQLRIVREELMNADVKLEKMRQKSAEANIQTQEILATERRKRLDTEENLRLSSEEIRTLKDQIIRQCNRYTKQLQKNESEIAKLRMKLSTQSTPSDDMKTRLESLTQTLVSKQQVLESLLTERNALRLRLEKIEHEFRDSRRNVSYNINDTDDAKAQVPTFLMETPFDTGVTRRVKRAYSSLDAISIRTGVFLRRYPLARILVLIYMALLQFWVLVVLLSQSPEAH